VTDSVDYVVRLGRGSEYALIIQRGRGKNAPFVAGVHFPRETPKRVLLAWRDRINRGIQKPNAAGEIRHCGERETIAQERNEHGEWVTPTKKTQIDLKEYERMRSIVQRIGILVATWIEQEDDWLYDSYESPETERGARDAILCAAEAVRQIFEEYKKEIES
jgi:hypothetical protein